MGSASDEEMPLRRPNRPSVDLLPESSAINNNKLKNFCESENQLRYLGLVLIAGVALINMMFFHQADSLWRKTVCEDKNFLSHNAPMNKFIAVASYPGSGNTYTRMLIENATGIYTGSVYYDQSLAQVLKGEGKIAGTVFVKTHYPCKFCFSKNVKLTSFLPPEKTGELLKAIRKEGLADANSKVASIFVIRNPFRAFLAEYQRQRHYRPANKARDRSHTGSVDWENEVLRPSFAEDFSNRFTFYINGWLNHAEYYTRFESGRSNYYKDQQGNSVYKVLFEDLVQKDREEASLQDILMFTRQFLGEDSIILKEFNHTVPCPSAEPNGGVDTYRRHKKFYNLQVFKERQVKYVCGNISAVWELRWGNCKMAYREVLV